MATAAGEGFGDLVGRPDGPWLRLGCSEGPMAVGPDELTSTPIPTPRPMATSSAVISAPIRAARVKAKASNRSFLTWGSSTFPRMAENRLNLSSGSGRGWVYPSGGGLKYGSATMARTAARADGE